MRRVVMLASIAVGSAIAGAGFAQTNDLGRPPATHAPAVAAAPVGSGTLSSNGTPTATLRVFRDDAPSSCGAAKAFPGTIGNGPFAYTSVSYTNSGPARCVTFTLNATCVNGLPAGVFLVGYSGAIDAADLSRNYLGDSGRSTGTGFAPAQMAVNLGTNQSITLMIQQVNNAATSPPSSCTFALLDDTQVPVPALSSASMAAMAGLLALLGFAFLRRRPVQGRVR
jgi:hypothetical protein